jgi:site-specific recombinase XerD
MSHTRISPLHRQIASFKRWLQYQNKSDNTVEIYTHAARRFATWAETEHDVTDWGQVKASHIRDFVIAILEQWTPGYASNLFRALQQFAKWYAREEGVPNPMADMTPPMVPEQETPVLREEQLRALLRSCDGKEFLQRRDAAILYLFLDSGIRRGELANLQVDDVDLDHREVTVLGKGRRTRTVAFGRKAAWALDRYLTERARHRQAELPALWLGEKNKGPMTGSGVFQMIQRRGERVGIRGLHPHVMRHTWAHLMKASSMADDEIMKNAGWRSPQMLARYAASTAAARARDSARRLAPGDKL